MAKYYNPSRVNLQYARDSILRNGGDESLTRYRNGTIHHSLYLKSHNWHLSWDEKPDGSIEEIHSTYNNKPIWAYESGLD